MIDFFLHLFDPAEAPTAARGGALSGITGWLHLASDMAIFFAYAVICALLMMFLFRQRNLPYRRTIWLIWLFMLACGITRLAGAAMLYYPAFRLLLMVKILTAVVSLITVFALARIFPTMLGFEINSKSHRKSIEDEERLRRVSDDFAEQRDKLEQRATQLTVRDRRVRRSLESSGSAAVCWDAASNEITWAVGLKELLGPQTEIADPAQSWSQFLGAHECSQILSAARGAIESNSELSIGLSIRCADGREGHFSLRARADPLSAGGRPTFTGLVWFVPDSVPA
ncbi:MAG: hypothetical protein JNM86_16825 [Phycisphaerae bacterium]|nr:hypothetical protein [Phycisphaerae bacterium]MBN8597890.1 hypothetical protein [Planctomycetota bacterium]